MTDPSRPKIGKYRIVKKLQQGGMGQVYLGFDETAETEKVAIKTLNAERDSDRTLIMRQFDLEAKTLLKINHKNVVRILEYGEDGSVPYLAMEYFPGFNLADAMRFLCLSYHDFLQLLLQCAEGIAQIHAAKIIHRDLKPSNILVNREMHAKIIDFGIAKPQSETTVSDVTEKGKLMGTFQFFAPELLTGGSATEVSDIYALGITFINALIGYNPFQSADGKVDINKAVAEGFQFSPEERLYIPPEVEEILCKMVDRHPDQRHQSGRQLYKEVKQILDKTKNSHNIFYFPYSKYFSIANTIEVHKLIKTRVPNNIFFQSIIAMSALNQSYGKNISLDLPVPDQPDNVTVEEKRFLQTYNYMVSNVEKFIEDRSADDTETISIVSDQIQMTEGVSDNTIELGLNENLHLPGGVDNDNFDEASIVVDEKTHSGVRVDFNTGSHETTGKIETTNSRVHRNKLEQHVESNRGVGAKISAAMARAPKLKLRTVVILGAIAGAMYYFQLYKLLL